MRINNNKKMDNNMLNESRLSNISFNLDVRTKNNFNNNDNNDIVIYYTNIVT